MLPYFWQLLDKREGINAVITNLPLRMIIDMTTFTSETDAWDE